MSARTGSRYGVARKPVPRWVPGLADQLDQACRDARGAARRGPARTPAPGRGWPGCRGRSRPSACDELAPATRRARPSASSRVPRGVVGVAEHLGDPRREPHAERCRYAVATSALSPATKAPKSPTSTPGSSHSPQWKPVSHRYSSCGAGSGRARRARGCRRSRATARRSRPSAIIAGHGSASSRSSPYARYSSHGTMTAASPQPGGPVEDARSGRRGPSAGGTGDMLATRAVGPLVGREVAQPLRARTRPRRRGTPRSGAKICQSPVQPARSRCGQSVGMSHALPRKLHTAASCSRLTARRCTRTSRCAAGRCARRRRVTSSRRQRPGGPRSRTYWKPCVVCRGSKTSPGARPTTTSSTCPAGSGCGQDREVDGAGGRS